MYGPLDSLGACIAGMTMRLVAWALGLMRRPANTFRFTTWLLTGLALAAAPAPMRAEPPAAVAARMDIAAAVNMAGHQRMLSQRMAKAYLLLGQGIAADDARAVLQTSVSQFESQLATLKTFQPTPPVKDALAHLDAGWTKCKAVLATTPNKAGAVDLYDASESLLKAAHQATLAYESAGDAPLVHLVNLAGRQRMLSQRMAKFYLYSAWDLYHDPADMELHLTRAHFTATLNQIEASPLASMQAKAGIARLRREWEPYQQILFASRDPAEMRGNAARMAGSSERVLAATEALVAELVKPVSNATH